MQHSLHPDFNNQVATFCFSSCTSIILNSCNAGIWWGQTWLLGCTWDTMENSDLSQPLHFTVPQYSSLEIQLIFCYWYFMLLFSVTLLLQMLKFLMDYSPSSSAPTTSFNEDIFTFVPVKAKKLLVNSLLLSQKKLFLVNSFPSCVSGCHKQRSWKLYFPFWTTFC